MPSHKEARATRGQSPLLMPQTPIVAHMIVGARPEAYLSSALESIAPVCQHAVINDTAGQERNPNLEAIEQSTFAREGRLSVVRSSFVDFATARNGCIDATPARFAGGWGLIVDADEVHTGALASVAALAERVSERVDAIDGYLRHFVGSFSWWFELNRTRCLFRLGAGRRWENAIHERLADVDQRIAVPVVWFHYGHVVTPRMEAEKSRLYASLGQPDPAPTDTQLERARPATVWPGLLRRANRFKGEHPSAARPTIEALTRERADLFAQVDAIANAQPVWQRVRNVTRDFNARRLLWWRSVEARVAYGWRPTPADPRDDARSDQAVELQAIR